MMMLRQIVPSSVLRGTPATTTMRGVSHPSGVHANRMARLAFSTKSATSSTLSPSFSTTSVPCPLSLVDVRSSSSSLNRFLVSRRCFGTTVREVATADDAMRFSGYAEIDFTIDENAMVYDAVQKFAAFNIGCLVTTDTAGNMTGIVSERDYISKVALLGRTSKDTKIKEIATRGANIVTAKAGESVEACMEKMMQKGIRHLPIVDDEGSVVGMISIKDLVKTILSEKEQTIKVLSDFALGKGGHFTTD